MHIHMYTHTGIYTPTYIFLPVFSGQKELWHLEVCLVLRQMLVFGSSAHIICYLFGIQLGLQ